MAKVVRDKRMGVQSAGLYQVICDFESYPEFLPEVVSAKIVKKGKKTQVEFELEVIKKFGYLLEFTTKENEVSWELLSSNFFKENSGLWKLEPSGNEVDVHYELEVSFGFLVPSWVTKKLTETSLPAMFERFETRAKELINNSRL